MNDCGAHYKGVNGGFCLPLFSVVSGVFEMSKVSEMRRLGTYSAWGKRRYEAGRQALRAVGFVVY